MFNFLSKVSLSSWDEAWYAVISRNIYNSGDFFHLIFNDRPFYDHPPFVFWLQTLSYKLFGINEFSVRLPSLVLGILTVLVMYLLGKKLFGNLAGLFAGLALFTSPWFLTRSLSGNLDVPLTFLFVLSFYLAIFARENKKFLIPLSISLSFLFLTKSLVPFTIIPALIVVLWRKLKLKDLFLPAILFLLITLPWFVISYLNNSLFVQKYLSIGYPGEKSLSNLFENIMLTKTYLHNGMGNWFYFGFASIVLGFLFFRKYYLGIVVFITIFLFPFAFSNKGHIWHLIPLHPFWFLSLFGFIELMFNKFKKVKNLKFLFMTFVFLFISFNQIKRNWYETIKTSNYTSDIEVLATKSKEFNEPLFLDDDAIPETVFYSDKERVERITQRGDIRKMFDDKSSFLLITRDWRLNEENIKPKEYILIAKDRDKVLILKNEKAN